MRPVDIGIGRILHEALPEGEDDALAAEDRELAATLDVTERALLAQTGKIPEDYCTLVLEPAGPPKITGRTPTGDLILLIPFSLPKNVLHDVGRTPLFDPSQRLVERQTALLGLPPSGRITVRIDAIEPAARVELRRALRAQREAISRMFGETDGSSTDLTEDDNADMDKSVFEEPTP